MPSHEQTIFVPAPPERAWNFVTAVHRWPTWLRGVAGVSALSTPEPGAGTTFVVERRGQHHRDHWIVAEWEPPRRARFTDYHNDIQLVFEVMPSSGGSNLRVALQWRRVRGLLGDLFGSRSPGGRWAREIAVAAERLRELFERGRDLNLLRGEDDA